VLDGFERVLRAFGGLDAAYQGDETKSEGSDCDCISPLAEDFLRHLAVLPNLRSKVLLTTRLCPRVLEAKGGGFLQGCREEELRQMQPADAVEFFRAQGIRGTHTEIEQACEPYGYHPLSLRLLAGLIVGDFQQPGDIAAAKRLDVSGDLIQRQHHVLETAYDGLTPARQALLGLIACFRHPVKYEALKALAISGSSRPKKAHSKKGSERREESESIVTSAPAVKELDTDLRDLVARGLLHHDTREGRFDLHPIVRRYAYDGLAAPDRTAAHTSLRDYFAAMPKPEKVTRLEDLTPVIELYHHTVRAGQFDVAWTLFRDRIWRTLYYQLGAFQLQIDLLRALFPDGEDRPPRLKEESHQAHALNELANSYSLSAQPRCAVPLFEQQNAIQEKLGNKKNLAIGLGNVACMAQLHIGELRAAEANLRRCIALCRETKDEGTKGTGHYELGRVLACTGRWSECSQALDAGEEIKKRVAHVQAQGVIWAHRALRELLRLRSASQSAIRNLQSAIGPARRALNLAEGGDPNIGGAVFPQDLVRAHWLLGAAHRVAGQYDEAARRLHEALERCRRINLVEVEADILIDLARLRAAAGAPEEAARLAEEALVFTERSGYVLQGADAHLELAKLALARGDKATALEHAQEARSLATCDGPPDYTYKAAYDEATALLAQGVVSVE